MSVPSIKFHIGGFDQYQTIDFDKTEIKKAMREVGKLIRKDARKFVASRTKNANYPRKQTGVLQRSIRYKVSKPGFLVRVSPFMTNEMKEFYPAYLYNGVRQSPLRGRERVRARRKGGLKSKPFRIEPHRRNYVYDALEKNRIHVKSIVFNALKGALKPGGR